MLSKLLLPLLALASVALGTEVKRLDVTKNADEFLLSCAIDRPRLNETWDENVVFQACKATLDQIKSHADLYLAPFTCQHFVVDMCITTVCSMAFTGLLLSPASGVAGVLSRDILYKCIMGNWWGYLSNSDDTLLMSMTPAYPPPPHMELEQGPATKATTIQPESALVSPTKRDKADRYLSDGQVECRDSGRHLEGKECNEAYNRMFDEILWVEDISIQASSCRASNSTGNTCTVAICNLSGQDATYNVRQLIGTLKSNISWPCVEWQDKAGYWTDGMTSIFMG
ncbi:hypothetical protein QBC39DRAFT_378475 [Podospora conica]|nr:hypothetical protein QBC39DRAFT_378475 [Schizothecium conicum]